MCLLERNSEWPELSLHQLCVKASTRGFSGETPHISLKHLVPRDKGETASVPPHWDQWHQVTLKCGASCPLPVCFCSCHSEAMQCAARAGCPGNSSLSLVVSLPRGLEQMTSPL